VGVCVCDARDLGAVVVVDELLLRRRWRHGPHTKILGTGSSVTSLNVTVSVRFKTETRALHLI
jgi:hypothetical protein